MPVDGFVTHISSLPRFCKHKFPLSFAEFFCSGWVTLRMPTASSEPSTCRNWFWAEFLPFTVPNSLLKTGPFPCNIPSVFLSPQYVPTETEFDTLSSWKQHSSLFPSQTEFQQRLACPIETQVRQRLRLIISNVGVPKLRRSFFCQITAALQFSSASHVKSTESTWTTICCWRNKSSDLAYAYGPKKRVEKLVDPNQG